MKQTEFEVEHVFEDNLGRESISPEQTTKGKSFLIKGIE